MLGLLPVRVSRSDVVRQASVVSTVDPTIIDDADDGYRVGQRWINTELMTTWTLADATPGAAVWVQEDGGGGGGGLTQQDVRDALKLAASAGAPAAGSVDQKLDDIGNNTGLIPALI